MPQEGVTAVNNACLSLDFLVLITRTEASGNEIAISLKSHTFFFIFTLPYIVVLPCQAFPLDTKRLPLFLEFADFQ